MLVEKIRKPPSATVTFKTPQSLIHVKHRMTLVQYKLWVVLLQELKLQMDAGITANEDGYRFLSMKKVEELLGYQPEKQKIWRDLLALKNETIAYNVLGKDGESEKRGSGFISEWSTSTNRIGFVFPAILENTMRGLDNAKAIFQLLNWNVFNSFNGKYEAIIYKLCRDYVGVGRTPFMTVEKYREYIGLSDGEYDQFSKLNEWTITRPLKTLKASELTEIEVDVEYKRTGRKVIGLHFVVKPKQQTLLPFPEFEVLAKPNKLSSKQTGFAGLELNLLRQIQKQQPEITEKYVFEFAEQNNLYPIQALEKIKADYQADALMLGDLKDS